MLVAPNCTWWLHQPTRISERPPLCTNVTQHRASDYASFPTHNASTELVLIHSYTTQMALAMMVAPVHPILRARLALTARTVGRAAVRTTTCGQLSLRVATWWTVHGWLTMTLGASCTRTWGNRFAVLSPANAVPVHALPISPASAASASARALVLASLQSNRPSQRPLALCRTGSSPQLPFLLPVV